MSSQVQEIPDSTSGCACHWADQNAQQKLCKCGLVIDEDCYFTACDNPVDSYTVQSDGPCTFETETVDSVTFWYSRCRDGLISDLSGKPIHIFN